LLLYTIKEHQKLKIHVLRGCADALGINVSRLHVKRLRPTLDFQSVEAIIRILSDEKDKNTESSFSLKNKLMKQQLDSESILRKKLPTVYVTSFSH